MGAIVYGKSDKWKYQTGSNEKDSVKIWIKKALLNDAPCHGNDIALTMLFSCSRTLSAQWLRCVLIAFNGSVWWMASSYAKWSKMQSGCHLHRRIHDSKAQRDSNQRISVMCQATHNKIQWLGKKSIVSLSSNHGWAVEWAICVCLAIRSRIVSGSKWPTATNDSR